MNLMSQIRPPSRKMVMAGALTLGPLAIGASLLPSLLEGRRTAHALPAFRPHGPDLELLASTSPVILVHLAFGLLALLVGAILMAGRKGARMHRVLGWGWVVAVAVVAVSSLFIQVVNPGRFSLIHILSGYVIIALPLAVAAARRHDVERHRRYMSGLFYGGFAVNLIFVLLPGRLVWELILG
ncbi:MAG: DUF2306 domain-containing protein [Phenylobacterium sp.]